MKYVHLLFFIFLPVFLWSQSVIEVCPSCGVRSIRQALQQAKDFDVIQVTGGVYKEGNLVIDKKVKLIGKNHPILDGQSQNEILTIEADSVVVSGFKFINVGESYTKDFAAIRMVKSYGFRIESNRIEGAFYGIFVEKGGRGIIRNNQIEGKASLEYKSGNGIHLWYSKDMHIEGNEVYHLRDGIYFEFVKNTQIINNNSHHNIRYGLHFMFSDDNLYQNNRFESNGAGVAVMFSRRITMRGNSFIDNWGISSYGLLLKEIYDSSIEKNYFLRNTIGIHLESTTRIKYVNNTFSENGWAIRSPGGSYSNHFFKNNFLNNTFDLAYTGAMNDNIFRGNYWSQYTGYDINKDGVGDVPYRPVKLFSYIVNKSPESIILMRSLFVDIINFSEKVAPVFTPEELIDNEPLMKKINYDSH